MSILIALCGFALMLAASRAGTAAILLAALLVAGLGVGGAALYVVMPAALLFAGWIVWLYVRARRQVRAETRQGEQWLAAKEALEALRP